MKNLNKITSKMY